MELRSILYLFGLMGCIVTPDPTAHQAVLARIQTLEMSVGQHETTIEDELKPQLANLTTIEASVGRHEATIEDELKPQLTDLTTEVSSLQSTVSQHSMELEGLSEELQSIASLSTTIQYTTSNLVDEHFILMDDIASDLYGPTEVVVSVKGSGLNCGGIDTGSYSYAWAIWLVNWTSPYDMWVNGPHIVELASGSRDNACTTQITVSPFPSPIQGDPAGFVVEVVNAANALVTITIHQLIGSAQSDTP